MSADVGIPPNDIEATGQSVDLIFLRTGIVAESDAFMVEQSVIDAFAADGHHSRTSCEATIRGSTDSPCFPL